MLDCWCGRDGVSICIFIVGANVVLSTSVVKNADLRTYPIPSI
jgi:hypothetical protein